jgi:hypothetical protein
MGLNGSKAFPAPALVAGTNQAYWVDLFIPKNTPAGDHSVTVTVTFSSPTTNTTITSSSSNTTSNTTTTTTTIPLTLHVWDFALPSTSKRYATTYNCENKAIQTAIGNKSYTPTELAAIQKPYVELGLMHRITFADFLASEEGAAEGDEYALNKKDAKGLPTPDWNGIEERWGTFLNGTATLPFGLEDAAVTSVNLPNPFFGARSTGTNGSDHAYIDQLWHATGCLLPTPAWGYAYWGAQPDSGSSDMHVFVHATLTACNLPFFP